MLRFRRGMRSLPFMPPWVLAATVLLTAPAHAGQASPTVPSTWNNEALFDSTTTHAELLEMARSAAGMKHYDLAEIYYQEALLRDPDNIDLMLELAALYRRTGRLEYARGLLTRAGRLDPERNDIAETRRLVERDLFAQVSVEVDSLVARRQYDKALPRIGVLLSIDGENADVLSQKARCQWALGQTDAALTSIKLAVARDPRDEFFRLRDRIAADVERHRLDELEKSTRQLLASGTADRGRATEMLQAILAQDPSNEWAREQFRNLSAGDAPRLPSDPPPTQQVVDAVRSVVPGFAAAVEKHLRAILLFLGVIVVFCSPLTRAIVSRFGRRSMLSGDLARVDIADVLRTAHVSLLSGVIELRTPDGRASVYLQNGQPLHCKGFGLEGLGALNHILHNIHEGQFAHHPRHRSVTRTIDQPLDLILADGVAAPGGQKGTRRRKKSRMSELLETKSE